MSVRRWPDTLPGLTMTSLNVTPVDQNIRTNMEIGSPRIRTRTAQRRDTTNVEWRMTEAEFTAFRAWDQGAAYSLVGASDNLAAWEPFNVTLAAGAAVSAEGLAVDRLLETAENALHRQSFALPTVAADDTDLVLTAAFKAAGRNLCRLGLFDRASTSRHVDIDLATGLLSGASGLDAQSIKDLGGGWWRVTIGVNTGVGVSPPYMRILLRDDVGAITYVGDTGKGIDVCDVQARVRTGYDLYLPTAADGTVLGSANGAAWFNLRVAAGGGMNVAEVRFNSPWKASTLSALRRVVTAELEVRNA